MNSTPAKPPESSRAPLRGSFFVWTWLAVVFSIAVFSLLSWLRYEQVRTMREAGHVLDSISQARIDFAKGFLYVTLATDDPQSTFRRPEGLALIRQGISSLLEIQEHGIARDAMANEGRRSWTNFQSSLAPFFADLEAWTKTSEEERKPLELRLRVKFHELEQYASRIDYASKARLLDIEAGLSRTFAIALAFSAALLCAICAGIYVSGRSQRRAYRALQDREDQLRAVGDNLPSGYIYQFVRQPDGTSYFKYVSAGVERVHGISVSDCLQDAGLLFRRIAPDQARHYAQAEAESARTLSEFEMDIRVLAPDGQTRFFHVRSKPFRGSRGEVVWDGLVLDVSARRLAEEKIRKDEALLREMGRIAKVGGWEFDVATGEGWWSEEVARIHDLDPGVKPTREMGLMFYSPEDRARIDAAVDQAVRDGIPYDLELQLVSAVGVAKWVHTIGRPVYENGRVVRIRGSFQDITTVKRAEFALRDRESQLRQAQKLESIGQLAGGVAHDFNNVLAAVMMQAQLTEIDEATPPAVAEDMRQILRICERGANLARQLLLFGRQQVIQPRDIDINESVANISKMLQRVIGENIDIRLDLAPAPLLTRADPGMLDQVLLNLSVNARDAMEGSGRLTIRTVELEVDEALAALHPDAAPGRYVGLIVDDTGCGIPPDVLPRIFEPFFTTKEQGKGTGLGLATVFGIVKQHKGWIHVRTEVGRGTAFEVYLPAGGVLCAPACAEAAPVPLEGNETILLVEDDSSMRTLTARFLRAHGYKVLEAAHGVEALGIWDGRAGDIDLLLTDLLMPEGLNGRDLARKLQSAKPSLRTIYFSGYSADLVGRNSGLCAGENFLQKPVKPADLLRMLRKHLDSRNVPAEPSGDVVPSVPPSPRPPAN